MRRSPALLAAPATLALLLGACSQSTPDATETAPEASASPSVAATASSDASAAGTAAMGAATAAPGSTAAAVSTSTSTTASSTGAATASAPGATLNEAAVGSCWTDVTAQDASRARRVDCSEPHTLQVIATKDVLAVGDYDGDELGRGLTEACYTAATAYAATEDQGFLLGVPTQEQWDFAAANGATVTETCGIVTGSPTTGTLPPATPR